MISLFRTSRSMLTLLSGAALAIGCAAESAQTNSTSNDSTLDTAEALTVESSSSTDPIPEAVVTVEDVDAAADDAAGAAEDDAGPPEDVGCGMKGGPRKERIKKAFDANGDGTLDESEKADMQGAMERDDHPHRSKFGGKPHLMRRIVWAYDVDNNGTLDDSERAALKAALLARCEARKAQALEAFDKDQDGSLDQQERGAARKAHGDKRREKFEARHGKRDKNDDGKLSQDEKKAAREAAHAFYKAKREEMIAKFDKNGDGTLDAAEISELKAFIRARFEGQAPAENQE